MDPGSTPGDSTKNEKMKMGYKIFAVFVILFLSFFFFQKLFSDDFNVNPLYFFSQGFLIALNIYALWNNIRTERRLLWLRRKNDCITRVNNLIHRIRNTTTTF